MAGVRFDGMQVRRDIGWRAPGADAARRTPPPASTSTRATAPSPQMKAAVERTHGAEVVRGVGSFGGVFSAKAIAAMDDPVLVASTDGVGTKVELAARLGRVRGVGADIVNHCIDDVLVQAARPLFFLDYIAASALDADLVAEVVTGMAEACEAAGCTLLGGETAEMPGVYAPGAFDIAGTLVGVAERVGPAPPPRRRRRRRADRRGVERPAHQRLLAAAQAVRVDPDGRRARRARPPARRRPARTAPQLPRRARAGAGDRRDVKALAHITGGGLPENLPRVLPAGVDARDRARLVAGAAAVPAGARAGDRRSTPTSCTAR